MYTCVGMYVCMYPSSWQRLARTMFNSCAAQLLQWLIDEDKTPQAHKVSLLKWMLQTASQCIVTSVMV